jgi:hypothetical protein
MEYSKVATNDAVQASSSIQGGCASGSVPISKPPTQRRDKYYPIIFLMVATIMIVISSVIERKPYPGSLISAKFAGNWVSMIMIAPLLASFAGIALVILLSIPMFRGHLLSSSAIIACVCKLWLGNVFLLTTDLWIVGVILLLSLIGDGFRYAHSKENLTASLSLIEMGMEVNEPFDSMLTLTCFVVIVVQIFVLLWWGVVFVYVVSEVGKVQGVFIILMMMICLFWIVQFFHNFISVIVEGCLLWTFIRPADGTYRRGEHVHQVTLYARCAAGASLGSVCKAALFVAPAQTILSATSLLRWKMRSYGHRSRIVSWYAPKALAVLGKLEPWARSYHRLSLAYVATYGHTLHKAGEAINNRHDEIVDIMTLDSTSFMLKMLATWTAVVVSVLLVVIASIESNELGTVWPLFFFQCYVLTYSCVSLTLHGFRCAVDTLVLAYADSPEKFAEKNSLLYHRFLRISELDMD